MTRKRFLIIGLPVAFVLVASVLAFNPKSIHVVQPVRGHAVQAVYATGSVEATVMMPIAARASARLMEMSVDEGSDVHKGDVLAQLENTDLRRALDQAVAQEAYAKRDYARNEELVKTHATSKQTYDRSRSDWIAAQAAVAKARAEADYSNLISPADGRVIRRDGEIGQLIPSGQPVFWLAAGNAIRISAEVDEEDISMVQPGQKVLIRADAFPGQTFHGTVQAITPKGDAIARSYRVRVALDGETPLMIGMTAEINIIAQEKDNALLLPASAVTQKDEVWLVRDGALVRVPVKTGAKDVKEIEIIEGVQEGDSVIEKPDFTLKEGARVRADIVEWKKS